MSDWGRRLAGTFKRDNARRRLFEGFDFPMSNEAMKMAAARAALAHVQDGMRLGIGTGSTAEHFIALLGEAVSDGLSVTGVPTSERTARLCIDFGIALESIDDIGPIDLAIDGADEIDPDLNLIKGGGGALLREKIVAHAAQRMIVIADDSKCVDVLGRFALPIEVNGFGLQTTRQAIENVARRHGARGEVEVRVATKGEPMMTDGGHFIVDASFGHISDPQAAARDLSAIPGVIEHGLFLGIAELAIVAGDDGVRTLTPRKAANAA